MDVEKLLAFLADRRDRAKARRDGTGLVLFATFQGLIDRVKRGEFDEEDAR